MSDWNTEIIEEFRANDGVVGGHVEGRPLPLLHHQGARTGTRRVSPLMYQKVGSDFAVFASKGGADNNPSWFHNLRANPDTTIEIGGDTIEVRAHELQDDERESIWERQKRDYPQFADYEEKTARDEIPVLVLRPV